MIFNYFAYNLISIYGDSNFRQYHRRPRWSPVGMVLYICLGKEKKIAFATQNGCGDLEFDKA